jgi:L-ascorbate metabolism protein UlaG (beta-lactamase superfamily)
MDPWLVGPCWGGNIWLYPPSKKMPEDFSGIDYFYFSHAHDDHLHTKTLSRFHPQEKKSRTIIPNFGLSYFENAVRANGFNNIQMLEHNEVIEIAPGVKLTMLINDLGDHDSSILLHADGVTVMFQTDNLLSIDEAKRIGSKYQIDAVFTITSLTGIFPGFFDFPIDTMMRLSKEKCMRSLSYSLDIVKALGAKIVVPYASDLCYLGDLYFANDLHATDKRDFALMITHQGLDIQPLLMGPGDVLEISADRVIPILGDHDFGGASLGAYAVSMRDQVAEIAIEEHQYVAIPYQKDIALLRSIMDCQSINWGDENFRVLWEIVGPDGGKEFFCHLLPGTTQDCSAQWKYDLKIEMPSYRLQRLVRGDYKMGFLTMQNGSIRCNRHSENLTSNEKKYWAWAMGNIRFFKSS